MDGNHHRTPWTHRDLRIARGIVILALLLRVARLAANPSIYADAVALNVIDRGWGDLASPLEWQQEVPLGYLAAVKACVTWLGDSETVLRLVPFTAGCAALLFLRDAVVRLVPPRAGLLALGLVGASWRLVDYGALEKQYAVDAMAGALALSVFARACDGATGARFGVRAACGATALPFLSFAAPFALVPALSCAAAVRFRRGARGAATGLLAAAGVAAASAAAHLLVRTRDPSTESLLLDVWARHFAPAPVSPETILWYPLHVLELAWPLVAPPLPTVSATILALAALAGILVLRRRPALCLAVTGPLALALAAAALRLWPFGQRHLLFAAPGVALLCGIGTAALSARLRVAGIAATFLVAAEAVKATAASIVPPPKQEMRQIVAAMAPKVRRGDTVFLLPSAQQAWRYYARRQPTALIAVVSVVDAPVPNTDRGRLIAAIDGLRARGRVWFVISVAGPEDARNEGDAVGRAEDLGRRIDEIRAPNSAAHLFEFP